MSREYFNSRPCERGDLRRVIPKDVPYISIPAPARGATKSVDRKTRATIFQFPPLREGRQQCLTKNIYGFCLICCILYHI